MPRRRRVKGSLRSVLAMLTPLRSVALRCAWLHAALDPDVISASFATVVKVARNENKPNNPL